MALFLTSIVLIMDSCYPEIVGGFVGFNISDQISTFDNLEGGISRFIDIDGYYNSPCEHIFSEKKGVIFFDDGSCSCLDWKETPPIFENIPNISLKEHIKDDYYCTYKDIWKNPRKHFDLNGGLYVIHEDTIIMEEVILDNVLLLERYAFKVVDRKTIKLLYYEEVRKDHCELKSYENYDSISCLYRFFPAKDLPEPINMFNKDIKERWGDKSNYLIHHNKWKDYLKNKKL